ncbi:hypothetical protein Pan153_51490 [Gimesia panareensis]|uniref:Uncharacterized protein n=1 Tax=Gimesia panareensis TaxID=2527978 RepID=A0A518FVV6_9PLAN|nr:hypothetical protein [Gimesia panareensis]QDV20474.1 hypothetical protein Pan153_51490 [Gimesia panareensis]
MAKPQSDPDHYDLEKLLKQILIEYLHTLKKPGYKSPTFILNCAGLILIPIIISIIVNSFTSAQAKLDRIPDLIAGIENEYTRHTTIAALAKNGDDDLVLITTDKFPSETLKAIRDLKFCSELKQKVKISAISFANTHLEQHDQLVRSFDQKGEYLLEKLVDLHRAIEDTRTKELKNEDELSLKIEVIQLEVDDLVQRVRQNLVASQNDSKYRELKEHLNALQDKIKTNQYLLAQARTILIIKGVNELKSSKLESWDKFLTNFKDFIEIVNSNEPHCTEKKKDSLAKLKKAHNELLSRDSTLIYAICSELAAYPSPPN